MKSFEDRFGKYLGCKHAIGVNPCTAALHLALEAICVEEGDEIITSPMTFASTAEVVRYFNAKPLLVDCRVEDFNLDVADAERRIQLARSRGEEVVAILPVHYGGQMVDVVAVDQLAARYGLKVIEDAAHCCPAFYRKADGGRQKAEAGDQELEIGNQRSGNGDQRSEGRGQRAEPAPILRAYVQIKE